LRAAEDIAEDRWTVKQGSVLDEAFLESLGRFSYVHSWGVLHHTGAMWRALDNLLRFNAAADGWVHIALYNAHRTSNRWLRIKRLCNRSPHLAFPLIKSAYVTLLFARMLTRFQSPLRFVRDYRSTRGMSFFRDVDDWLGGLPYEFCTPGEVVDFLTDRQFTLRRLLTTQSCGCNEFLFHGEPTPH
jgi:2-polyprenyl-6-hydroxyphenyl methylase/3-demethylubiquinone-9 3-methyltransferase